MPENINFMACKMQLSAYQFSHFVMKIKKFHFYHKKTWPGEEDFLYCGKIGELAFDLGLSDTQIDLLMEAKRDLEQQDDFYEFVAKQNSHLDEYIQLEEPLQFPREDRKMASEINPFLRYKNQELDDQLELMEVKYVKPGVYTKLIKRKSPK